MSRVLTFLYCDQVQNNITPQGSNRNIVTPLVGLRPINIPGNFTFTIACTFGEVDAHENNHFKLQFQNPKGEIINTIDAVIPADMLPKDKVDKSEIDSLNLDVDLRNIPLMIEGEYKTVVYHNDVCLGEYPIIVRKGGE